MFGDAGAYAGLERGAEVIGGELLGDDDEERGRKLGGELAGGFDAVAFGHADIEHDEIGAEMEGRLDEGAAVRGGADDFEFGRQEPRQTVEQKGVVIGDHEPLAHSWFWSIAELYASGVCPLIDGADQVQHRRCC